MYSGDGRSRHILPIPGMIDIKPAAVGSQMKNNIADVALIRCPFNIRYRTNMTTSLLTDDELDHTYDLTSQHGSTCRPIRWPKWRFYVGGPAIPAYWSLTPGSALWRPIRERSEET